MAAGRRTLALGALALLLGTATGASAQVMREQEDPLDAFTFVDPRLRPSPSGATYDSAAPELEPHVRSGWTDFLAGAGGPWKGYVDRRTGRIDVAEGTGLPLLPGAGNSLAGSGGRTLDEMEATARAFLPRVVRMLGVDPGSLALSRQRSGLVAEHLWIVDFDVHLDGLPVEGARVVFRVNNGNLVQFGTENLPSPGTATPEERIGRKEALAVLAERIGGFSAADSFLDGGTARLLPLAERQGSTPGKGRGLARVWELVFRRRGSLGTWRARIDATTGDLLEFRDVNRYAQASGGVYPVSFLFADETVRPMPFADLSSGGFTNSAGTFTYPGSSVSSTLGGQYVKINDACGAVSQTSGGTGNIVFGTSGGTDCATPGSGGAGNTHSARTQFYHVNRIKEAGRGWLPSNAWLAAQLPVNVNIPDVCNAFWDGGSINFFRSGGGCGNTGEIAAISLHEYGHGLDDNDGTGFSFDLGTGEAYADVTAALMLRDSCMGPGFRGGNCTGYGDACTACSGVRDLDWAKRVSNVPHTVENFTRLRCPFVGGYDGPCSREGHCESYVASEAVWDLATRDLPDPGSAAAFAVTERLWYLSVPTATSAFSCNTASIPWTSNGCSAGSWWRTMRAADDDDGNLANGTPHSCHLFAAFDRHGIACASDTGANVCFSGCTPPAEPTVSLTPGNRQVALSWTSSGVGVTYDVFRSENGCGSGFVKVADGVSGTVYEDDAVANNLTYSYMVVAHTAGNGACAAPPTDCQSAVPQAPPCPTPPPAPTGVTAAAQGVDRIAVSWNPVPGAVEYRLFRSPTSGGPWTQIGTLLPPAASHLDTGLAQGTTYFYTVRAATGENCESPGSSEAAAATVQCQTATLYQSSFETGSGLADWTVSALNGPGSAVDWRGIQACAAQSGTRIFRFGGQGCFDVYKPNQHGAARPQEAAGFVIPVGSGLTKLSFWHRREFEFGGDGGTLKISVDGGSYVHVPAAALSGSLYNASIGPACAPPGTAGTPIFTSFRDFEQTVVDLETACNAATGTNLGCGGHTIRISFEVINNCVFEAAGWFLDDVSVITCVPHGCTGAPVLGTATTPADNQVLLSWSNGTPASDAFNVYRALGSCASPGPFTKIATGVGASPYLDSPVSGTTTYAYRVAGLDDTGICESDMSACADVVPTGPCTLPPTFAGLADVDDAGFATCSTALSWSSASSSCGGAVSYDVFRSTDPTFVPAAGNRIATGLTGTSFADSGTLQYGTTYYYVVRAVDSATGLVDGNTVRLSATPTGPLMLPATVPETFEDLDGFDRGGWSHGSTTGDGTDWTWDGSRSHSPSRSWHAQGWPFQSDRVLVSPPLRVAPGSSLSFWHTYEFEACFDGGALEVSADNGFKWAAVPASSFTTGGYTEVVYGSGNPIFGRPAWCHGTLGAMTRVQLDLSLWSGKTIQVRWHAGDDSSVASPGWYVDSVTFHDVVVSDGCVSEPPPPLDFHTVPPCRVVDTRSLTPPAIEANGIRTFQVAGLCGVPADAKAVSVNLTVIDPGSPGELSLFRADQVPPLANAISFRGGVTRSNNGLVFLSPAGQVSVNPLTFLPLHFALDVTGYFLQDPP